MQRRALLIAFAPLCLSTSAAPQAPQRSASSTLRLTKPTIVILVDSPSEQKRNAKQDPNYNEATGDFGAYTNRMLAVLKGRKEFTILWSHADRVVFSTTSVQPITRTAVGGGWGYVYYSPGKAPMIVEGVATDDELVCRATVMFGIKVEGYKCEA